MMGQIVSYEVAALAREKGFLEHCDWRYTEYDDNKLVNWKDEQVKECIEYDITYAYKAVESLADSYFHIFKHRDDGWYLAAPTQSFLQAWLRNEHKIEIAVQWFDKGYIKAVKKHPFKNNTYRMETWNSYEEALEMALFEALNLIPDEG